MPTTETKPAAAARKSRPSDREYAAMIRKRVGEMDDVIGQLAQGKIDLDTWADRFDAILLEGHTQAYVLGRQRAGDLSAESEDDVFAGRDVKDQQGEFLQDFLDALRDEDPRYWNEDGTLNERAVQNRARLYAARMRGTSNEAFLDAGEADDEYDWLLGAAEHCKDCIELEKLGPYTRDTAISHPGDGQTDCKANCHCRWRRRRDKVTGFDRVDIYLGQAA